LDSAQAYANEVLENATAAARAWAELDQAATDRIVHAIHEATLAQRVELARMAFDETGIGVFEHKVMKNGWASLLVYEDIRPRRTVGVLREDEPTGTVEIARPRGPVLAFTPVTNPTSTVIFKALISAKTRNPLIFSPHGGAKRCSRAAARVCYEAAREAGAPEHAIQWLKRSHKDVLQAVMSHRKLALILATGTGDLVHWAQRSGNPVLGVGPGNVPVYVHEDCSLDLAARSIAHSKTWDNGSVCASEQALIVPSSVNRRLRKLLEGRGSYFCSPEETRRLAEVAYDEQRRSMSVRVVGHSAADIAHQAGFKIPSRTRLLIAELEGVGREHPLSHEILAPILSYYVVDNLDEALRLASEVSHLGGVGHTVCVWTADPGVIARFAEEVPAGRVCVNQPATQGAIGGLYNALPPSLTLGTGSGGGNLTTDNITVEHLLTIQRVVRRRENPRWFNVSRDTWLDDDTPAAEIYRRYNRLW
jgi:acetaldehyde dehydrogenase/alcohol dehydrogenase